MSPSHSAPELLSRAESLLLTDPGEALSLSLEAEALARTRKDPLRQALALRLQGHALKGLERHHEALEAYARSRRLHLRIGERVEAARTEIGRVDALMYLDRTREARRVGRRALRELTSLGETLRAGRLLSNLGNLEYRLDRPRPALDLYLEARRLLGRARSPLDVGMVDYNIGNIRVQLGELEEAGRDYASARTAARRAGHALLKLHVDYALAGLDISLGRLTEALRRLASCERRFAEIGHERGRCNSLLDRAEAYRELHLEEDAEHVAAQAQEGFHALGLGYDEARAMFHRGSAVLHGGDLRGGRALLGRAARRFANLGNQVQAAAVRLRLGQAVEADRLSRPRREELRRELEGARHTFRRHGFHLLTLETSVELARLAMAEGNAARARGLLRAIERDLDARLHPELAAQVEYLELLLARGRGDHDGVMARAETMFAHLETARDRLVDDEFLASHLWQHRGLYQTWIRLLASRGETDPGTLHRGLARLEVLAEGRRRNLRGRRESDAAEMVALRSRLASLTTRERHLLPSDPVSDPRNRREARRLEREFTERLRRDRLARSRTTDRGDAPPPGLEEFQSRLRPGELWLQTFDEGEGLGFLLVTRGRAGVVPGRIERDALDSALEDVRYQFDRYHMDPDFARRHSETLGAAAERALARLGELLPAAVRDRLAESEHLFVRPAGGADRIPWGAMPLDGRPLWSRAAVTLVPGTRWLGSRRTRNPLPPAGTCAIWSPEAPDLPQAIEEAREVARALGGAPVIAAGEATREAFLARSRSSRLLHFCGHGRFREDNPLLSSLQLTDDSLYFVDLERLSLRADLVVLSACRAGGARTGMELGTGLARGFLRAGARNLVLSPWPVGDADTRRLMGRFYRRMAAGDPPAGALREAAREGFEGGEHPAAWGTFQVLGAP